MSCPKAARLKGHLGDTMQYYAPCENWWRGLPGSWWTLPQLPHKPHRPPHLVVAGFQGLPAALNPAGRRLGLGLRPALLGPPRCRPLAARLRGSPAPGSLALAAAVAHPGLPCVGMDGLAGKDPSCVLQWKSGSHWLWVHAPHRPGPAALSNLRRRPAGRADLVRPLVATVRCWQGRRGPKASPGPRERWELCFARGALAGFRSAIYVWH